VTTNARVARLVARPAVAAALLLLPACVVIQENTQPDCHSAAPLRLMAAAVPTATRIPCVRSLPLGWDFGRFDAQRGDVQFTLDANAEDAGVVLVDLRRSCDTSDATAQRSDEEGTMRYSTESSSPGAYRRAILYVFTGGCVSYRFSFSRRPAADVLASMLDAATFVRPPFSASASTSASETAAPGASA
jgi:hypothetical protein